jgi:outer membrane protein
MNSRTFIAQAFPVAAAATMLAFAGPACAQLAGSLVVRGGVTQIAPDVNSGELTAPSLAGTRADVRSDTQPTAGITWMWSGNIALDLPLAAGFKHDMVGDGAIAGSGKIAEARALPVTLLAQYRLFDAKAALRPYFGAGPTYAKFYKVRSTAVLTAITGGSPSRPTTVSVQSKWAPTVQAGLVYQLNGPWSIDAAVLKTFLKTRATLSTGQTLDVKLDPWSYTVGVGYRF